MIQKRTRLTTAFLAIGLAGALLAGCGDDGDDDDNVGGQNAPGGNQTVEVTGTEAPTSGNEQDTGNANSIGSREIKIVDATPVTRRGSDGSMAGNRPEGSPEASPEASPAASPEASPAA